MTVPMIVLEERPAWYGGNKIPDSYTKKFWPYERKHEDLPEELRFFLNQMEEK